MPVGGPLIRDGQVIGAIGISGGSLEQDEEAAHLTIEEVGLSIGK